MIECYRSKSSRLVLKFDQQPQRKNNHKGIGCDVFDAAWQIIVCGNDLPGHFRRVADTLMAQEKQIPTTIGPETFRAGRSPISGF